MYSDRNHKSGFQWGRESEWNNAWRKLSGIIETFYTLIRIKIRGTYAIIKIQIVHFQ